MSLVIDESSTEFRQLCHDYYYGKLDPVYQDFLDRFVDSASELKKENFVFENEAVKGINRRVNYLPIEPVLDGKEKHQVEYDYWNGYFKGSYFDGKSLSLLLRSIYRNMELYGAAILVGHVNPQDPKNPIWLLMTTIEYYPMTNPENIFDIYAYKFAYYRTEIDENEKKKEVKVEVVVNRAEYKTLADDEELPDLTKPNPIAPVLPVVVFCREDLDGIYCRPGMANLLNGQRNLNLALTKRNEATKFNGFKVWCPADEEHSGLDLQKKSSSQSGMSIRPGSYVPFPIKAEGDSGSIVPIEKEIEEARNDIRAAALFLDPVDYKGTQDGESGKAKLIGSRGIRDYSTQMLGQIKKGLNELLEKSALLANQSSEGLAFKMPSVDKEDPVLALEKAERMYTRGFEKEALRREGYDNDEIERLLAEREISLDEEEVRALNRVKNEVLNTG